MSRYKRQVKLKLKEQIEGVATAVQATSEAAAQALLSHAQFHLAEAERFQYAARILRGDTPGEDSPHDIAFDEREAKRVKWREAAALRRSRLKRGLIQPRKTKKPKGQAQRSYWDKLSPLQRKREMAHRLAVRAGTAAPRPHVRPNKVLKMPMGGVA